jgi:flagellar biosynthesis protein FliR
MSADALQLIGFSGAYVSRYFLALVRVMAALSFNPMLGSGRVPVIGRIGLALFVTLVLFPPTADAPPVTVGPAEIAGEVLLGALAGFTVALVFAAVQFAAGLIGINAGFSIGQTLDPHNDLGTGVLEQFFAAFALLVFVQMNGHHIFLAGLHDLFDVVAVGSVPLVPGTAERLAVVSGALFAAALKISLPVLAALLLADLGLAVLARVAPQLNLFALGLPAKMAIGLAALMVALPVMLPRIIALFRAVPDSMLLLAR